MGVNGNIEFNMGQNNIAVNNEELEYPMMTNNLNQVNNLNKINSNNLLGGL